MEWCVECKPAYSLLKVYLEPSECVTAEAGAMVLIRGDVEIKTHTGGGFLRGLLRAFAADETVFLNTYVAKSPSELWFAPGVPGDIEFIELNGDEWVIQDTSYLAHYGDVELGIAWRGLRGFLAEGELMWLKVSGYGGVWVNAYGGLQKVEVAPGERIIIDNFHFVAMPANVDWCIRKFGGWKSTLFGGEGIVVEVRGPATVYLQTRILPPFAKLISKYAKRS
ncbi:MAG: TIGR00266 family protein [Thermoprotei archaeon]|nr:MAG: TIGR00266 family protein [Thermoprotei archaeon]